MTGKEPRITLQGMKVLRCFADDVARELSGADITKAAGLLSGTLYPLLIRFENAGWLTSRWEEDSPVEIGRPKRRLYRITGAGVRMFRNRLEEVMPGDPSWA
jgi:DNA-binding PadR family transcriptional regulator